MIRSLAMGNTTLSTLYSELGRKPDDTSLEEFLQQSNPQKYKSFAQYFRIFPTHELEKFRGSYSCFCRSFLMHWIIDQDPPLFRSAHFGRKVVMDAVYNSDRDLHDIFRHALLLGDFEAGSSLEEWWHAVSEIARNRLNDESDAKRQELGRKGELIVFKRERELCEKLSSGLKPELVSFEDNFKGWDITTFRETEHGLEKVFLEVKTSMTNREFFISWREARRARVLAKKWQLVLVSVPDGKAYYHTADGILPHIPFPTSDGVSWQECKLPVALLGKATLCDEFDIGQRFPHS